MRPLYFSTFTGDLYGGRLTVTVAWRNELEVLWATAAVDDGTGRLGPGFVLDHKREEVRP